jgi:acetylornithine aminotransferase
MKISNKIVEAKRALLQAMSEQSSEIQGIKPPDKKLQESYNQELKKISEHRGMPLWFPYLGSGIGNGPFVKLQDGSVKYDFICGIGVHHFGHNHPLLMEAALDGALSDIIWQGNLQQNQDQADLIHLLVKTSGLDHAFLSTGGSLAVENGLKIAFQKRFPASRVLAFEGCFAGRTMATAAISDKPAYRQGLPIVLNVDYVPFFNPDKPQESQERAQTILKQYLKRFPGQHAAMIFELVQGEGGFYPGSTSFFRGLMEILKKEGIAVFVDEVQTFGRLSKPFAFQHFGLEDLVDIVSLGKMAHICATLFRSSWTPKPGLLSQTFTASTAAIHAARTILLELESKGFFGEGGKNMQIGEKFTKKLQALHQKYPDKINGPYGLGAMCAFTPLDGSSEKATALVKALFENGVMSFIAGANPTRVRFLVPAGVLTEKHLDEVIAILEETIQCI